MQTTQPVEQSTATSVLVLGCQVGVSAEGTLRILRDAGFAEEGGDAAAKRLRGNEQSMPAQQGLAVIDPDTATGIASLAQWLADVPSAHLLLLHQRPERPVAEAIASGEAVEDALTEWRTSAEGLLAVCRRDRRRVTLLDAHAAAAAPAECLARLGDRLKKHLPKPSTSPADTTPDTSVMDRAIAALAVQQSEETQALLGELEASSMSVGDPIRLAVPDTESVVQEHSGAGGSSDTRQQLEEENELLLLQLHQVQEELESYYLEAKNKGEQLNKSTDETQKLKRENKKLQERVDSLERNLTDIKNSTSWKLTVPLRAVRGGPRRHGKSTTESQS